MRFRVRSRAAYLHLGFMIFVAFLVIYGISSALSQEKLENIRRELRGKPLRAVNTGLLDHLQPPPGENTAKIYNLTDHGYPSVDLLNQGNDFDPKKIHRIVHLDLKGAPPSLAYMRELFPLLRRLGATGLLMEYEDMFPYWGNLEILARHNAYNKTVIAEINKLAHENKLIIVPLVQTFGHFEFVLKHNEFKHLREVPDKIQNLNPALPESLKVVAQMIQQILALHPMAQYIHIGGDEVRSLGKSHESIELMKEKGLHTSDLFLYHITNVLKSAKLNHPMVTCIMWDDMLRRIEPDILKAYKMGSLVEPMVWLYVPNVPGHFSPRFWARYAQVFSSVWTASSFKGATGQAQYIVDIGYHVSNNAAWARVMKDTHSKNFPKMKFSGIALTGWQRYDHVLPLCELLPVGVPSLAVNLHVLLNNHLGKQDFRRPADWLKCDKPIPLKLPASEDDLVKCSFPGSDIYHAVSDLRLTRVGIESFLKRAVRDEKKRTLIKQRVLHHMNNLPRVLLEVFGQDAVQEFMEINVIKPLYKLSDIKREAQDLLSHRYPWMRPPRQM